MSPADNIRNLPDRAPDSGEGAKVYVPCASCGKPVRLPLPESPVPARCDNCGALADSSAKDT